MSRSMAAHGVLSGALPLCTSIFTTPILLRWVGSEGYATYAVATACAAMIHAGKPVSTET